MSAAFDVDGCLGNWIATPSACCRPIWPQAVGPRRANAAARRRTYFIGPPFVIARATARQGQRLQWRWKMPHSQAYPPRRKEAADAEAWIPVADTRAHHGRSP